MNGWMRLASSARGHTAGFQEKEYGCFREPWGDGDGIPLSSSSSETGPVLVTRDPAVDKTIMPRGSSGRRSKVLRFLNDRCQVVMKAMKRDKAGERTERVSGGHREQSGETLSRVSEPVGGCGKGAQDQGQPQQRFCTQNPVDEHLWGVGRYHCHSTLRMRRQDPASGCDGAFLSQLLPPMSVRQACVEDPVTPIILRLNFSLVGKPVSGFGNLQPMLAVDAQRYFMTSVSPGAGLFQSGWRVWTLDLGENPAFPSLSAPL